MKLPQAASATGLVMCACNNKAKGPKLSAYSLAPASRLYAESLQGLLLFQPVAPHMTLPSMD